MQKNITTSGLLLKIGEGDKNSFEVFFRLYYEKFIKISLQYVRGYNNAEEIISDVFLKILNTAYKLHEIERIEAYLFRMVKNQCLDFLKRKENRYLVLIDEIEGNHFADSGDLRLEIEGNELKTIIMHCIDQFPPKRKLVYKLVKEDCLKLKEVGEILNISPKTVENHLDLAIKSLRGAVEQYYSELETDIPIRSIKGQKNKSN